MSQQIRSSTPQRLSDAIMSVELVTAGPAATIVVSGQIDLSNAHLVTELVDQALAQRPDELVLDLADVTFFSADGINILLLVRRTASAHRTRLTLRDPSPITRKLLDLTGMTAHFQISTTGTGS